MRAARHGRNGTTRASAFHVPGRDNLPELSSNLTQATAAKPIFPEVQRELDLTDGCAAQFDGKDNYHQVAEWPTKVGIARNHSILITMHGKNICDSLSNVIHAALRSAVANGEIVDPGTLALVRWLAEHKQVPTVTKVKKEGWWAIDDIYYGYFDPKLFTKVAGVRAIQRTIVGSAHSSPCGERACQAAGGEREPVARKGTPRRRATGTVRLNSFQGGVTRPLVQRASRIHE